MLCIGGIPRVGEWVSLGLRGNVTIWFLFELFLVFIVWVWVGSLPY